MDARLAKLEASATHMERDLAQMRPSLQDARERLVRIEERVTHLPGKGFVVSALLATLAALTGVILFAERLRDLLGPTL